MEPHDKHHPSIKKESSKSVEHVKSSEVPNMNTKIATVKLRTSFY